MKIWQLDARLWVPLPPQDVFPFFADAHNLESLTPPFLSFCIVTPDPIVMAEGTRIDYRIGVHGIPMRWRTRIARWEPPHAFADEQLRGPYAFWHHTHTFEPADGGTLLGDTVRMRPRGGPLAGLMMRAFIRRDVERIFRYRTEALVRSFGGRGEDATLEWTTATNNR